MTAAAPGAVTAIIAEVECLYCALRLEARDQTAYQTIAKVLADACNRRQAKSAIKRRLSNRCLERDSDRWYKFWRLHTWRTSS